MTAEAAGVDMSPPLPTHTRPTPLAAAISRITYIYVIIQQQQEEEKEDHHHHQQQQQQQTEEEEEQGVNHGIRY